MAQDSPLSDFDLNRITKISGGFLAQITALGV